MRRRGRQPAGPGSYGAPAFSRSPPVLTPQDRPAVCGGSRWGPRSEVWPLLKTGRKMVSAPYFKEEAKGPMD